MAVIAGPVLVGAPNPSIRRMEGRRDGMVVADLLELSFRDEPFDEGGRRLLYMLRHYGPFEAAMLGNSTAFVWDDDGALLGNASIQRNPLRKDTWLIGNVATHPAHRNRGIGTALVQRAIEHAGAHGAKHIALQVVDGNAAAVRVYARLGFRKLGVITHYERPSVHIVALATPDPPADDLAPAARAATRRDRNFVWQVSRFNIPDALTYAEPFDANMYRLGWRWSLMNSFNGNHEQWHVVERNGSRVGAARTRVNFDMSDHHLELLLAPEATERDGLALLHRALLRFERYVGKPVYAAQPLPHPTTHAVVQALGFKPARTLAHMRLDL